MKKTIVILTVLMLVTGSVYAMGSRARYAPGTDPVKIQNMWDGLSQITPYCDATVGKLTAYSQINEPEKYAKWEQCYNCKRLEWAKKWNNKFEIDTYSKLCLS